MERRLFLGQAVAGLSLQLLPFALTSHSASGKSISLPSEADRKVQALASTIQQGAIGSLEQLTITHVYSPEQTSMATLGALVQQDLALVSQLTGLHIPVDNQILFADSSSAAFGSYSANFAVNDVAVTWQGLARIGTNSNAPTGTLCLSGSAGVLRMSTSAMDCQLLNFQGRPLPVGNTQSILL